MKKKILKLLYVILCQNIAFSKRFICVGDKNFFRKNQKFPFNIYVKRNMIQPRVNLKIKSLFTKINLESNGHPNGAYTDINIVSEIVKV